MPDEALSAGAVARRLGVAVTTLRTWHQRYGLGPSQHVAGQHRRYTPADLARLEVMRRLTADGVPPAEAARWAREAGIPPAEAARDGGGHAIPVGRAGPAARGLARAAMRLDGPAMREIIARAVANHGVVAAWDAVLRPVLAGVGERHAATRRLVEVEHLLTRCVSEVLGAVPRPPADGRSPRTLLACADEEQHSLPLEALAAALAEAGIDCRQFGARVPPGALADAVARTGPAVVVLWAHASATADPAQVTDLLAASDRPLLAVAAGPGWDHDRLPAEVAVPQSLAEALALTRVVATRSSDQPLG